jgi:hypothetical protein
VEPLTIGPVVSSCNIPTIPLAEAQALSPRPPSPAARDATQRASRRENTNTLTARDASVLMSLDTSSGQRRRASQNMTIPSRPSRDNRRPSAARPSVSIAIEDDSSQVASFYPDESNESKQLVAWVNSRLPPIYPRAASIPQSFVSGEVIFLLVRSMSGIEPNPPVPPNAFAAVDGQPGIPGLFAMMDQLIDAGVDTAGVSLADVRSGDSASIIKLLQSVQIWSRGLAQ